MSNLQKEYIHHIKIFSSCIIIVCSVLILAYITNWILPTSVVISSNLETSSASESIEEEEQYASYDNFPVIKYDDQDPKEIMSYYSDRFDPNVLGKVIDPDLKYKDTEVNLPLAQYDYYFRKWQNAKSATKELNGMPTLKVGDRIKIIQDGYLTFDSRFGYEKVYNYYYASGVCWAVSTLGQLMDYANKEFKAKFGLVLFVYYRGDRAPHGHTYTTYKKSNYGYGYTVLKTQSESSTQDYGFQINPKLAERDDLKDLKLDIILTASETYSGAYKGQAIGGYILSNKDF